MRQGLAATATAILGREIVQGKEKRSEYSSDFGSDLRRQTGVQGFSLVDTGLHCRGAQQVKGKAPKMT